MSATPNVLTFESRQVIEECYFCHMLFGMPAQFQEQRRFDGATFYCPAGHSQCYTRSEKARLEAELVTAKARAEREAEWKRIAENQRDRSDRKLRSTRGVVTRMKKRVGAGCCPCCKRHFTNLERHMATQHPKFVKDEK